MLPSTSISFAPMSPALIKDFEDKKYQQFSILKAYKPLVIPLTKKLKNEQLIAGMAFRFFGLHNMPNYKVDASFLQNRDFTELPIKALHLLAELEKNNDFANEGGIYSNKISKYKSDLAFDLPSNNVISFSIALKEKEIVLAYNTSKSEACEKFIMLNCPFTKDVSFLETIYGYDANSYIQVFNSVFNKIKIPYIRLYLKPMQLIILKNF